MLSFTWIEACAVLFKALGLDTNLPPEQQPENLPDLLRGSGYLAECKTLIEHNLPAIDGQVGCLLLIGENNWLPVLGSGHDAVILTQDGLVLRLIEAADLESVTEAWVVTENIVSLARVMPFLHKYKDRFIELFVCGLIVNFFGLTLPLFSSFVYDKILGNGVTETLWALVIGLLIVVIVEFCVRVLRVIITERFAVSSESAIDHSTFHNLLNAKSNALPGIGSILEKYKQILSYRDFLSSSYMLALVDLPFLVLFIFVITLVAGPLVLVPLICGTLMIVSGLAFMSPVLEYDHQARRAGEKRFGLITDLLMSREAIIGSALHDELSRRWRQASVAAATTSSLARYWRNIGMTLANSISYLSYIGVIVGGVYMVEDHSLTSGGLLAASMLTSRTVGSFSSVTSLLIRYNEFRTALRELNNVFPVAKHHTARRSHGRLSGAIRLDRVTCRLRQGTYPILNDISLNIPAGQMVGIAGAPGAGKTTLLRLITGVLEPDEGQVLIDNIPLDKLSREDISVNIGFKPQDFALLDGTIEDNVRAGRRPLTAEQRQEILESSGLLRCFNDSGLNWTTEIGGGAAPVFRVDNNNWYHSHGLSSVIRQFFCSMSQQMGWMRPWKQISCGICPARKAKAQFWSVPTAVIC